MFIQLGGSCYAVIKRLVVEDWPVCMPRTSDLSDVVALYGNLQSLVGEDIIPAHECDDLLAIDVTRIRAKVVCMKMDCSSCLFLARLPNIIECD